MVSLRHRLVSIFWYFWGGSLACFLLVFVCLLPLHITTNLVWYTNSGAPWCIVLVGTILEWSSVMRISWHHQCELWISYCFSLAIAEDRMHAEKTEMELCNEKSAQLSWMMLSNEWCMVVPPWLNTMLSSSSCTMIFIVLAVSASATSFCVDLSIRCIGSYEKWNKQIKTSHEQYPTFYFLKLSANASLSFFFKGFQELRFLQHWYYINK